MTAKRIIELLSQLLDVDTTGKQDGDALTYDLATDTWVPGAGGGGGAPTTADYLVGTAQGGLSAEIVVGATPGGELGGTWALPTVDATHSGSSHAATQAAAEATAQAALDAHLSDAADAHDASAISVLDTAADFTATDVEGALAELQSDHEGDAQALADHIADATDAHDASAISSVPAGGLTATEVQAALNELDTEKAAAASAVMDGDAAGGVLSGTYPDPGFAVDMATQAELDAHTGDTSDAHDASAISILDTANDFTATEVEGALAELQADAEADATALSDHIADASAAHAASAISVDSTTLVGTGTDVQAVFEELDNGIADHLADTADAHDASAVSFTPTGTIAATDVQAAIAEVASEAGGAMVLISDTLLGADAASFDITGIPGTYKHLKIIVQARGAAATTQVAHNVRLNNDSGGNYDALEVRWDEAGSGSAAGFIAQTEARMGFGPAANNTAGAAASGEILIANYAGSTFWKQLRAQYAAADADGGNSDYVIHNAGIWKNTAAVTRVTLFPSSGNWLAGSRLTIYGLN